MEEYPDWDRLYAEADPYDRPGARGGVGKVVDMVNEPPHYIFDDGVEVIDLTEQLNFNCGNVVKYTARAGRKNPDTALEDLEKAEFYIKREIARVKRRTAVD